MGRGGFVVVMDGPGGSGVGGGCFDSHVAPAVPMIRGAQGLCPVMKFLVAGGFVSHGPVFRMRTWRDAFVGLLCARPLANVFCSCLQAWLEGPVHRGGYREFCWFGDEDGYLIGPVRSDRPILHNVVQLRVIVITDRHPVDPEEAYRYMAAYCGVGCRLSVVGIGWGALAQFVEGASKAGGGGADFVADRGRATALARTLAVQLEEALQPVLRDVELDWSTLQAILGAGAAKGGDGRQIHLLPWPEAAAAVRPALLRSGSEVEAFGQGGVREILAPPIEASAVERGGRLLSVAFVGHAGWDSDPSAAPTLQVWAVVGGRLRVANVSLLGGLVRVGSVLHGLVAGRMAAALESDGAGTLFAGAASRAWQLCALGTVMASPSTRRVGCRLCWSAFGGLWSFRGSVPVLGLGGLPGGRCPWAGKRLSFASLVLCCTRSPQGSCLGVIRRPSRGSPP